MSIVVTPIPRLVELAVPAFTLGTANAAGSATTAVASDATILTFAAPALTLGTSNIIGDAATAMPSNSTVLAFDTTVATNTGTPAAGSSTVAGRRDHVHGIGAAASNLDLGSYLLVGNGGSTGIAISSGGEVTMAAQPAFIASSGATASNVTGDGTIYTIVLSTEIADRNGDFASTTFTAPVAGLYSFNILIFLLALASDHTEMNLTVVASNRSLLTRMQNSGDDALQKSQHLSVIVDMDASDTVTFTTQVSGGSKVVDILGGATTTGSGILLV